MQRGTKSPAQNVFVLSEFQQPIGSLMCLNIYITLSLFLFKQKVEKQAYKELLSI